MTCSRVKPFLPGLLIPSARVRIPTPITVHVDHCPECEEDLAALRELHLGPGQLERLGHLYACRAAAHAQLCRRARSKIAVFVRGVVADLDGEILDHLCTCPRCRSRVHRARQKLLAKGTVPTSGAACSMPMSGARLFDYVVPYSRSAESIPRATAELAEASPAGRAPERNRAGGLDAMVPGDTGANRVAAPQDHVRTCRSCLKRIHELDETIYGIAERTDSGVATIYSAQPPAAEIPGSFADPYPGYPIHVRVLPGVPAPAPASSWSPAGVKAALKRSTCDPRVRLILKTAVAAAAVIPLAILFFNTSTAEGVTLGQMFKAFGRAPNVRVTTFDARTQERVQDAWISRKADRILIVAGQTRILHDLKAGTESSRHDAQTPSGTTLLNERQRARARRAMDACLGFTLHDVPADAKWARVGN
ncbi:MAG: hypothetical protein MUC88_23120, partial [Planctomycetes bacterium]|nr:hypothetical protein [Planctomycetota bacterium]